MPWALPGRGHSATVLNATIKRGQTGIQVWALQRAISLLPDTPDVALDGDFGPGTEAAVKGVQSRARLTADGVAGPITQRYIVGKNVSLADAHLPVHLLDGFAQMEGGYLIAPMNWSSPGGVDCGAFQRRVYTEDFDSDPVIQRAFDTKYQAGLLAGRLVELRSIFRPRAGTNDGSMPPNEKAWRLAALNHNYPSAADRISRTPIRSLPSYWTSAQEWVTVHGFKFPDGTPVRTPLQWSHLYAGVLGSAYGHKGNVTKLVSDWTP